MIVLGVSIIHWQYESYSSCTQLEVMFLVVISPSPGLRLGVQVSQRLLASKLHSSNFGPESDHLLLQWRGGGGGNDGAYQNQVQIQMRSTHWQGPSRNHRV